MSDVDFEYADLLLHVAEGAGRVGNLPHLSSAAMEELNRMNTEIGDARKAESKRLAEEAAVARAAELKAKEDAMFEEEPLDELEETDPSVRRV